MEKFGFFITSMPNSRPADYYLGCLGGSVFIDFNIYDSNLVYLKRISFDGYGCYILNNKTVIPVNRKDSLILIKMLNRKSIKQEVMKRIIKATINCNKKTLPIEALTKYGFI